jgi:hypothetical protein
VIEMTLLAAIIDWGSIGLVLVFALITGAIIVGAFSFGLVNLDRYEKGRGTATGDDARPADPATVTAQDRGSLALLSLIVAVFCFAVCVLGVAAGLWAMLNKVS